MTNEKIAGYGWLPMRRIIVLVFILAALLAGVARQRSAQATGTATDPQYTVIEQMDNRTTIIDQDGDQWQCAGDVNAANCSMVARDDSGPAAQLGYSSAELAERECANGTVQPLYRRNQIVGYTCLVDWRLSLGEGVRP